MRSFKTAVSTAVLGRNLSAIVAADNLGRAALRTGKVRRTNSIGNRRLTRGTLLLDNDFFHNPFASGVFKKVRGSAVLKKFI